MSVKTAPSPGYKCPHKPKFFACKECQGNFCARCIQLEVHFCPNLETRSKNEKDELSKKLVKCVAAKVLAF